MHISVKSYIKEVSIWFTDLRKTVRENRYKKDKYQFGRGKTADRSPLYRLSACQGFDSFSQRLRKGFSIGGRDSLYSLFERTRG